MTPLFLRFGLPWLIFCSALYAFYWNVLYGERAYSNTPIARVASPSVQPVVINTSEVAKRNEPEQSRREVVAAAALNPSPSRLEHQATLNNTSSVAAMQPQLNSPDLMSELQSADPNVRLQALTESDAQGVVIPSHTLQQMATSDRDSAVRIEALTKYSQDPTIEPAMVMAAAEAALRDGNAALSARAREILEQMNQAIRSNDELPAVAPGDAPVE